MSKAKTTEELIVQRGLPRDEWNEEMLLGYAIRPEGVFARIGARLNEGDFTTEGRRRIFRAMCDVQKVAGEVNWVSVSSELTSRGQLESVGGRGYLGDLDAMGYGADIYTEKQFQDHLGVVREKSLLRKLVFALDSSLQRCLSNEKSAAVIPGLIEKLRELSGEYSDIHAKAKTGTEIIEESGGVNRFLSAGQLEGYIRTPWPELNAMAVGLRPTKLWILGARPSCGKTTAALQIACRAGRAGQNVAFFSLEMPAQDLIRNATAAVANVNSHQLHHGTFLGEELSRVNRAINEVAQYPIEYFEFTDKDPSKIRLRLETLLACKSIDLVVIDYLQLLSGTHRTDNRNQELSEISRSLKLMAGEFRIPFLVLSQLTRNPARENRAPDLRDLRDSGAIEQEADVVLFLHPIAGQADNTRMIISKNRLGPTGEFGMQFEKEFSRFREDSSE
jgi:replicative DNA helicase